MDSSEVIRLSFGPLANATSSHLCNLETLSIVNDYSDEAVVNPLVTHRSVHEYERDLTLLVPRTVFVDQDSRMYRNRESVSSSHVPDNDRAVVCWDGRVEVAERFVHFDGEDVGKSSDRDTSNHDEDKVNEEEYQAYFEEFHKCSGSSLAMAMSQSTYMKQMKSTAKCSEEKRHVNWDDDEYELDNDEDARLRRQENEREEARKLDHLNAMSSRAWKNCPKPRHWSDYLMIPYYSTLNDMMLRIPNILPNNENDYMSSFLAGWKIEEGSLTGRNFREDILSESLRSILEESDRVGGFQLLVDVTNSFYSGLATSLLEELEDECKSAARFCVGCDQHEETGARLHGIFNNSSQDQRRKQFRRSINTPLSIHGLVENSDLFLPLDLSSCSRYTSHSEKSEWDEVFYGSGVAALLLDTSTTSYRINRTHRSQIATTGCGMNFYDRDFVSRQSHSFHDFISSLLPNSAFGIVQMSGIASMTTKDFNDRLYDGTSIMYEKLMRSNSSLRHRFSKENLGKWLSCSNIISTMYSRDMSTSQMNRSLNTHFALASSMRCTDENIDESLLCQLESLNNYRPNRSTVFSTSYSLDRLVQKGSYWEESFLSRIGHLQEGRQDSKPLIGILENSTLCHQFVRRHANDLKNSLSRSMKGFYARDVMEGLLMDSDESMDALETLATLGDNYDPGIGSLEDDTADTYYDGNED